MTATSHATIGAVIAVVIKRPEVALPLAFLSHFVADTVPHFGFPGHKGIGDALKHKSAKVMLAVDPLMFFCLIILLIHFSALVYVYIAALLAASPDIEWLLSYLIYERRGKTSPRYGLTTFHEKIQWAERPWGLIADLTVVFGGFGLLIHLLR